MDQNKTDIQRQINDRAREFRMSLREHGMQKSIYVSASQNPNVKFIQNVIVGIGITAGVVAIPSLFMGSNSSNENEAATEKRSHSGQVTPYKSEKSNEIPRTDLAKDSPDINNQKIIAADNVNDLQGKLSYINENFQGKEYKILDARSRILLVKTAAKEAGLSEVGMNWKDLYGIIHAETNWVPRKGMGKNGVESHGLGQFEMATAKGYAIDNPNDPLQAVRGVALYAKDAALWAQGKTKDLNLKENDKDRAILEGVSVFYNTSWKIRRTWTPETGHNLPSATKTHITNVEAGRHIAKKLLSQINDGENVVKPDYELLSNAKRLAQQMTSHLFVEPDKKVTRISKRRLD